MQEGQLECCSFLRLKRCIRPTHVTINLLCSSIRKAPAISDRCPALFFISLSVCFYKIIWCDRRNLGIFKISHIAGDNVISSDILCTFILQTILKSLEGIFFNCINDLCL